MQIVYLRGYFAVLLSISAGYQKIISHLSGGYVKVFIKMENIYIEFPGTIGVRPTLLTGQVE